MTVYFVPVAVADKLNERDTIHSALNFFFNTTFIKVILSSIICTQAFTGHNPEEGIKTGEKAGRNFL